MGGEVDVDVGRSEGGFGGFGREHPSSTRIGRDHRTVHTALVVLMDSTGTG